MSTTEVIATPADLEAEVPVVVQWAKGLTISNQEEFEDTGMRLQQIKGAIKRLGDFFRPMKRKQDEAKQAILDKEKEALRPWTEAETLAKRAILTYTDQQRRVAEDRRRKLQAEADEQARREREALQKKAETSVKPETKQRYAEAAANVSAPIVHVAPSVEKVAGVSVRKTWKAEIVDRAAFMAFVHEHKRDDLVLPNEKVLDAYAKAMKQAASIPGVLFSEEQSLASSSR